MAEVESEAERLAEVLKALGHPARLRIYARLSSGCTPGVASDPDCVRACVGDIAVNLGIAPSTVSHHLKELRRVGLIRMRRAGQSVECWAEPEGLKLVADLSERVHALGNE